MNIEDFKYCSIDNLEDAINLLDEVLKNTKELHGMFNPIYNLDNFKGHLRLDNLMTDELETFINTYMRYYNE